MRRLMVVVLLVLCAGLAWSAMAPPVAEYPARRWTGTRWKTLANYNAGLLAYPKLTSWPDDTTGTKIRLTYNATSTLWSAAVTTTGTYAIVDWWSEPDSLVWGLSSVWIVGSDLGGSGSGDITGIGVRSGGAFPAYLKIQGDSLTGNPLLYLNVGSDGVSGTLDARYLNNTAGQIGPGVLASNSVNCWNVISSTTAVDTYVLSFYNNSFKWVPPASGGSGVSSVTSANSSIVVTNGTTTPLLTFDASTLDSRFMNTANETASLATSAGVAVGWNGSTGTAYMTAGGAITGASVAATGDVSGGTLSTVGTITGGNASGVGVIELYNASTTAKTRIEAYSGSTASPTFRLPSDRPPTPDQVLVCTSLIGDIAVLGWKPAGAGVVTSITGGTGISVTGTAAVPIVSANTTYFNANYYNTATAGSLVALDVTSSSGLITLGTTAVQAMIAMRASSTGFTQIRPSPSVSGITTHFITPPTDGAANTVLTTSGSGVTQWSTGLTLASSVTSGGLLSAGSDVRLKNLGGTKYVTLSTDPAQAADYTLRWPVDAGGGAGNNGHQLTTDGFGVLRWGDPSTGQALVARGGDILLMGGDFAPRDTSTIYFDPTAGSFPSFIFSYVDTLFQNDTTGTRSDLSFLAVDTTVIVTEVETSPLTFSRVDISGAFTADSLAVASWLSADSIDARTAIFNVIKADSALVGRLDMDSLSIRTSRGSAGQYPRSAGSGVVSWDNVDSSDVVDGTMSTHDLNIRGTWEEYAILADDGSGHMAWWNKNALLGGSMDSTFFYTAQCITTRQLKVKTGAPYAAAAGRQLTSFGSDGMGWQYGDSTMHADGKGSIKDVKIGGTAGVGKILTGTGTTGVAWSARPEPVYGKTNKSSTTNRKAIYVPGMTTSGAATANEDMGDVTGSVVPMVFGVYCKTDSVIFYANTASPISFDYSYQLP